MTKREISSIGVEDSDKIMRKGTLHVKLFKERIICTTHQKLSTILDRLRSEEEKDIVEYLLLLRRQEGMVTGWRE